MKAVTTWASAHGMCGCRVPQRREARLESRAPALVLALCATLTSGASAQVTDFYMYDGRQITVTIQENEIGIVARPSATEADIADLFVQFNVTPDTVIGGRIHVGTLPQTRPRETLVSLARSIAAQGQAWIHRAGMSVELEGWSGAALVTDEFVVQFHPNVPPVLIATMNAAHGVQVVREAPLIPNNYVLRATAASSLDAIGLAQLYHLSPLTEFAQPDFVYLAEPLVGPSERAREVKGRSAPDTGRSTLPPDPLLGEQWHLHNDGSRIGTPDADIDAPEAWLVERGDPETLIAMIEWLGYDPTHNDLVPNIWINPGEIAGDMADNGDPFQKPDDVSGWDFYGCPGLPDCGSPDLTNAADAFHEAHANASTGLVAAKGDNGQGVSGVCPDCSVMLLRTGVTGSSLADAIEYAWGMGADIINLSLHIPYDIIVRKAVQVAADQGRGGRGSLLVWSACYPWNCPDLCSTVAPRVEALDSVMTVTWTSPDDEGVDFVSFPRINGDCLDVGAPGDFIATTDNSLADGYNSQHPLVPAVCSDAMVDEDYTLCYRGTSAAAPIAAGVAGLVLSRNPGLRWWEVKDIIERTADMIDVLNVDPVGQWLDTTGDGNIDFSDWYGHGRVNAHQALLGTPPPSIVGPVSCEEAGTCDICEENPDACPPSQAADWEFGARMGATIIRTPSTRTVVNGPGGGPMGHPIFHATWFANPGPLMVEGQLGFSSITEGNSVDRSLTLALQPAYQWTGGGSSPYLGFNTAYHYAETSTLTDSDVALGIAFGFRFFPKSYLALRLEARYRYWIDQSLDELGLAAGFGVLLN